VGEETEFGHSRLGEREPVRGRSDGDPGLEQADLTGGLDPDVELSLRDGHTDEADVHKLTGYQIATDRLSGLSESSDRQAYASSNRDHECGEGGVTKKRRCGHE